MDKNGGAMFLTVLFFCVLLVAFLAFWGLGEDNIQDTQSITEHTFENQNSITEPPIPEQAVETAASGEVKGAVISQQLSAYKANTAYNNVFINNKTKTGTAINIANILKTASSVKFESSNEVQVLIVHTHTTECYLPEDRDYYTDADLSRSENSAINVTAVGELVAERLNEAGFKTLHDTTVHDKTYTGSYTRSADTITKYLEQYKSIKLVIDIHRDSVSSGEDKVKPVTEINGKKAAQVMLVTGCGEGIDGYENWQGNLNFAVKFQQTMEVMYPTLARAMTFLNSRYNQNLHTASLLLEVGTDANSIEEALTGADFAAQALISYLNTIKE